MVFSSNVLEHVPHLTQLHAEIRRVLKPGGMCLHVLPTHAWRFWTILSAFPVGFQKAIALTPGVWRRAKSAPRKLLGLLAAPFVALGYILAPLAPSRHGERGNAISELWLFRPQFWRKNFRANGFDIVRDEPMGLSTRVTSGLAHAAPWSAAASGRAASAAPVTCSRCACGLRAAATQIAPDPITCRHEHPLLLGGETKRQQRAQVRRPTDDDDQRDLAPTGNWSRPSASSTPSAHRAAPNGLISDHWNANTR